MSQVRLERKPVNEEPELLKILQKDIVFRIKFYILLGSAMILFLLICFMLKPQTYGFL